MPTEIIFKNPPLVNHWQEQLQGSWIRQKVYVCLTVEAWRVPLCLCVYVCVCVCVRLYTEWGPTPVKISGWNYREKFFNKDGIRSPLPPSPLLSPPAPVSLSTAPDYGCLHLGGGGMAACFNNRAGHFLYFLLVSITKKDLLHFLPS